MDLLSFWPRRHRCTLLKLGADTLERLDAHPDKGDTVLLLDALDEDPAARGRIEARLLELLQASLHFRRVIISCRTQFFPETGVDSFGRPGRVVIGGYTCPMYFMSLFDDEQVQRYLGKRFPDRVQDRLLWRANPLRQRAAALVKPIGSLRFRPLLLAHIESVLEGDPRLAAGAAAGAAGQWSAYRLYEALVGEWLRREQRKLRQQLAEPPTHAALLAVCMQVAVHLQATGERALSKAALEAMSARHPALRHLQGFNVGGRSLLNRNHSGAYRLSHYSIQEFLVVRALAQGLLDLRTGLLTLNPDAPDWQRQAVPVFESGQRLRLTDQMLAFIADTDAALVLDQQSCDFGDLRPAGRAGLAIRARLPNGTPAPVMQYIPPGFVPTAAPRADAARPRRPAQPLEIADGFWFGRHPVTFDEYDAFCAATGRAPPNDQGWGRGTRPVINVSFHDAVAYCEWLSGQTGETYRLPTEVEWEYACRAGSRTQYSFGDSERDLDAHAWYERNAGGMTHPVGEKRPNAWGLHDMHGNVWEWCDSFYDQPGADAPRVLRGGAFDDQAGGLRASNRGRDGPRIRGLIIGFRCVLAPPRQP